MGVVVGLLSVAGSEYGLWASQDVEARGSGVVRPVRRLFGQDGADEADDGVAVRVDPRDVRELAPCRASRIRANWACAATGP